MAEKLTDEKFAKLIDWMKHGANIWLLSEQPSREKAAEKATEDLGFKVTISFITRVMKATNIFFGKVANCGTGRDRLRSVSMEIEDWFNNHLLSQINNQWGGKVKLINLKKFFERRV